MHGGSGLSAEDYREAISRGIRKINYYTYGARAIRPEPAASEEAAGFVSTPPSRRRSGGG